jgi:pimeloyl-ACP methyl ester carboxylesterase
MKKYLIIVLTLVLAGCATTPKEPDLKRLYAVSSADRSQNPVILIHGIFGARLRTKDDNKEIWPGPLTKFLFGNLDSLALEIDAESLRPVEGDSEAYGLFGKFAGRDYYDQIWSALEEAGGYAFGQPGQPNATNAQQFYVFIYDWRQDLVQTAAKLNRFINQIRRDYQDPDLKVDIVAHSMGALLTRYYLRYGSEDVLGADTFRPNHVGAAKTRKVILLGAPNMGSISGLQLFMKGQKGQKFGLARLYPEILATMPSTYQLLPHPDRDWMITIDGKKWDRDLYAVQTWRDFQWSIFDPKARKRITKRFSSPAQANRYLAVLERYFERNLVRTKAFHRALSIPLNQTPVHYIVFGGDCVLTPARCAVERVKGQTHIRLYPSEITHPIRGIDYEKLMLEPGDGRVTKPSLLGRNSLDPSRLATNGGAFPLAYAVGHPKLTGKACQQDHRDAVRLRRSREPIQKTPDQNRVLKSAKQARPCGRAFFEPLPRFTTT